MPRKRANPHKAPVPREQHGLSKTKEFTTWWAMKRRCTEPTAPDYARYGGAGITVCAEWMKSFLAFYKHIGPRPSDVHSLDRIDNTRGYEPGNVRWATRVQQANNKNNNHIVEYKGATVTVAEAVRRAGSIISRETALCRLKNGWSPAAAVETPLLFKRDPLTRRRLAV
jgi:hypothetical protein